MITVPGGYMKKDRILYLDILKSIAIFMVVFMHCIEYPDTIGHFTWDVCVLMGSITKFCIPAFVMTSGIFMLDENRKLSIKKLYTKYILRFVIAYIFWAGLYALYSSELLFNVDITHIKKFVNNFIMGHFHLWYLWMIIGLYMCIPILRRIASDRNTMIYFIVLTFFASSVVPFVDAVTGVDFLPIIDNKLFINISVYACMFMIGYYIYKYILNSDANINRKSIIVILISVMATMFLTVFSKDLKTYFEDYMPLNILYGAAVFCLISKVNISDRLNKIIVVISNNSFGIYLSHVFVIYLYDNFMLISMNNALESIIKTVIVFIVSFGISIILKKIPVAGKYIA